MTIGKIKYQVQNVETRAFALKKAKSKSRASKWVEFLNDATGSSSYRVVAIEPLNAGVKAAEAVAMCDGTPECIAPDHLRECWKWRA